MSRVSHGWAFEMDKLGRQHSLEMNTLARQHDLEIDKLTRQNDLEMDKLRRQHDSEMTTLHHRLIASRKPTDPPIGSNRQVLLNSRLMIVANVSDATAPL
jgi:hypothetical protein